MLKSMFCLNVAHVIRAHRRSPNSVFQLEMCSDGLRTNTQNKHRKSQNIHPKFNQNGYQNLKKNGLEQKNT